MKRKVSEKVDLKREMVSPQGGLSQVGLSVTVRQT